MSDIALSEFVSINPESLTHQECYKLLIGSILPRPIAFVSSCSPEGELNLAPFSFFNGVCSNPPTVMFSIMRRGSDGAKKDTLVNIEQTREFVVNIVSEDIVRPMNQTAAEYPYGVSEFEQAGLTPIASQKVAVPRVQEAPINLECQLNQIVQIGDGSVGSGCIVIGTIVYFHLKEAVYQNGYIVTDKLKPVSRLAGSFYAPVREAFDLPRP